MKRLLLILMMAPLLMWGQVSPSKVVRVAGTTATFNENLPAGITIVDNSTGYKYITLLPVASTKTIATCTLDTDIRMNNAPASETVRGEIPIALQTDALAAEDDTKAITPLKMRDFVKANVVTYNEANQDINLGTYNIKADTVQVTNLQINGVTFNVNGPTIGVGTVTTGAAGSSAQVTETAVTGGKNFNFTIPRGDTGAQGPAGAAGAAATVTVGTTSTGAAGSSASVSNSGTSSAAVLNFTIPRGDTGATGATGPQGPQGIKGDTGATGPQGLQGEPGTNGTNGTAATVTVGTTTTGAEGTSASVTNSGTSSAAVFNFTIPRGATGATGSPGATGPAGSAATVTVGTTTTGAAGTSASVTNSGTSSAAVFNFTIPKGDKGDTGPIGPQGPAGTGSGTVSSVAMTVPTGLTVTGSPVTTTGTLAVSLQTGYKIPTIAKLDQYDDSYNHMGQVGMLYNSSAYGVLHYSDFTYDDAGHFYRLNLKTVGGNSLIGSGDVPFPSASWGNITGTLANQTDLNNALAGKAALSGSLSQAFNVSSLTVEAGTYDWGISGSSGTLTFSQYGGNISFLSGRVSGTGFDASGSITSGSTITATGAITGSNLVGTSDRRLKENIKPLDKDFSDIKFFEYSFKSDTSHRKRYGVIAQDLLKNHPELVYVNPDGSLGVAQVDLLMAKVAQQDKILSSMRKDIITLTILIGLMIMTVVFLSLKKKNNEK